MMSSTEMLQVLSNYGFAVFAGVLGLVVAVWCLRVFWRWALTNITNAGKWLGGIVTKFVDSHLETQKLMAKSVESLSVACAETLSLTRGIHDALVGKNSAQK